MKPISKTCIACLRLLLLSLLLLSIAGSALAEPMRLIPLVGDWLEPEQGVHFSGSLQLQTLLPFTEDRVEMMNRLLGHLSFAAFFEQDEGATLTNFSLACDEQPLFTLTEREGNGLSTLQTSLLPNIVLESNTSSGLNWLIGAEAETPGPSFDFTAAIESAGFYYKKLIDACEPYAQSKKANYKIKSIGSAKWSQIARLTAEQSDEMLPELRAVLQCGMDPAHKQSLSEVRFGKGFVVALYKLGENDADLAVYMKGTLLYPDGTKANLTYQWAFIEQDDVRKDSYKYDLNRQSKPRETRVVDATLSRSLTRDQFTAKGSIVLTTRENNITTAQTEKIDLSGRNAGSAKTLQGTTSLQIKTTADGTSLTTLETLTPTLTLTKQLGGDILSGSVSVESKKDKAVISSVLYTFAESISAMAASEDTSLYMVSEPEEVPELPLVSLLQIADEADDDGSVPALASAAPEALPDVPIGLRRYAQPQMSVTVSLDSAPKAELIALQNEVFQSLAGRLLLALAKLPEEDTVLLRDGMTEEDYASFQALLGANE